MMNVRDLRNEVVRPALEHIDRWSLPAEQLVLATAVHESNACYLRQIGGGPALGLWQMEPATEEDIWGNYLVYRKPLASAVRALLASSPSRTSQLVTNLLYGAAMARIHYLRDPRPLPPAGDARAMGECWKRHYNTPLGAGTVGGFESTFNQYVRPLYT